jgi:magnesium-transporting ATPase (P-type)
MGQSVSSARLEASEPPDEARLNGLLGLPRSEVFAALGSSVRGLSATEAAARFAAVGPNALPAARRRSIPAWFFRQFVDLFALMLVAAAGFTVLAFLLQSPRDSGTMNLAIAILGIVV